MKGTGRKHINNLFSNILSKIDQYENGFSSIFFVSELTEVDLYTEFRLIHRWIKITIIIIVVALIT